MKFLKENKLAVLSIGVIILIAILLAIPGQTAHMGVLKKEYTYYLSGYEFFFNTRTISDVIDTPLGSSIVASGIAIIVLAPFAIASICLGKKSSFFVLLASLFNLAMSILFFSMEACAVKSYPLYANVEDKSICSWVPYLAGALLILVALYLGYKAVMMMKDEIKHPSQPKGPSYNYLKK